jgi:hypothetical protein
MEEEKINIIMRQTTYTAEESSSKLTHFNGDVLNVLRDYLNIYKSNQPDKSANVPASVNQQIYKEFHELFKSPKMK